ncbi:DoxX family protein [Nocardiopsis sp. NRRL B-16309]|uniref:DoxX family protein n=1 Tax=Nocardiopsis sp. NRRL B-16309 TaxID=1519494 RepID=UPI0006ADA874|nr:DoxX family protein [Nocardiopsis sp. NRRL B-16309]KOX11327.1 membrane protein [Nocardiopsis sp. NRRL B-16309]
MDLALWIVAGLLAAAYVFGGAGKLVVPKERIAAFGRSARWVEDWSPGGVKAIGALEVLGGLGLVLPAVLGVAPVLVPLAALGLAMVMVGAALTRVRRREFDLMAVDLGYLVLLLFVVWGRFVLAPFTG